MLNRVYRLVSPRVFQPVECKIELAQTCVVRPVRLSICNADMRYYLGRRSAEVLARKLPMALIHEGVGEVVYDATHTFTPGTLVVMIPNHPHEVDPYIAENYLLSSDFCGSGHDGFMREYVACNPSTLVALPKTIDLDVAAFTELVSVAVHAVTRFEAIAHNRRESVGIWGDGNLGYIVALVLRMCYPSMHISVIGRNAYKLNDFTFADQTIISSNVDDLTIDHAFECCGGDGSQAAIDQIIDVISPEGTISLLGVSENPVPINTRMVLERGLRLFGSSRSGRADFMRVVDLYKEHPEMVAYLKALVGDVISVQGIPDMVRAFESDTRKTMGKTIMKWEV